MILALPVDGILQSLGVMMFSELASENLPLRAFFPTETGVEEYKSKSLDRLQSTYANTIDNSISTLATIQAQILTTRQESPPITRPTPDGTSPTKRHTTPFSSPKESRTLKRTHSRVSLSGANDENRSPRRASEIKAVKNAKLLKALRDVEKTLGSMEVEEQHRYNEVF